jgi:hypothetical protein
VSGWKSTSSAPTTARRASPGPAPPQLGGYALALETWQGIRPKKGLLVRIGKDGATEAKEVDLEAAREHLQRALALYKFLVE